MIDLVVPSAIRHGIHPPVVEDLTQPNQAYRAPNHATVASHFGWTVAVPTIGLNRYVDVYLPPVHDHYPDHT